GDPVEDPDGVFLYIRDRESGRFWSAGRQPVPHPQDEYSAGWRPGVLTITRLANGIETRVEVCVPPDSGTETRRITLANRSSRERRIELTGYAEVVLDRPESFAAHPAFSKLFLETAFLPDERALLATRRPRSNAERHPLIFQALLGKGTLEWESDRARFLGRDGSLAAPAALLTRAPLSGSLGPVLDPVLSLRCSTTIGPGEEARHLFLLGIADTREAAIDSIRARGSDIDIGRDFARAEEAARAGIARIGLREDRAEAWQALGGAVLYGDPSLRAAPEILRRFRGRPADLLRLGVSPERPFIVLHAGREDGAPLLTELRTAHRYWNSLGISIPLVVVCEEPSAIERALRGGESEGLLVIRRGEIPHETLDLLDGAARMVVRDALPEPAGFAGDRAPASADTPSGSAGAVADSGPHRSPQAKEERADLLFFNEHGGFSENDGAYVIRLQRREGSMRGLPPLPWINVIANDRIGFLVSETGAGGTWGRNSREHRLTPWSNDPVLDPHGEALYIRDEENGAFWSPLPGPAPADGDYEMRHGFGCTLCRHESHGLEQETSLFVPPEDPVKVARIRIVNRSGRARRLSLFSYRRLVLGALPETSGRFVATEIDPESGAVLAVSRMGDGEGQAVAFSAVVARGEGVAIHASGDRMRFIGRHASPARPAALLRTDPIEGRFGAGLDSCFAEQAVLAVAPGESAECSFLLGEGDDREEARALVNRYRAEGAIERALGEARAFWRGVLSGLRVETPEPAIDLMVNGWLPYQAIACRLKGRTAFYQSGGAFGFRDQLQDASSLVYLRP
ncbi:MAG: glycosyl transferase, partial [Candidatus Eisenbacteria bacterium]